MHPPESKGQARDCGERPPEKPDSCCCGSLRPPASDALPAREARQEPDKEQPVLPHRPKGKVSPADQKTSLFLCVPGRVPEVYGPAGPGSICRVSTRSQADPPRPPR